MLDFLSQTFVLVVFFGCKYLDSFYWVGSQHLINSFLEPLKLVCVYMLPFYQRVVCKDLPTIYQIGLDLTRHLTLTFVCWCLIIVCTVWEETSLLLLGDNFWECISRLCWFRDRHFHIFALHYAAVRKRSLSHPERSSPEMVTRRMSFFVFI